MEQSFLKYPISRIFFCQSSFLSLYYLCRYNVFKTFQKQTKILIKAKQLLWLSLLILFSISILGMLCANNPIEPSDRPIELTLIKIERLDLKIISPEDGAKVEHITMVKGTVSGLPQEYAIKVLVRHHKTDLWYPQQAVSIKADLSWNTTVYLGLERESGDNFDIGAIAVTGKQLDIFNKDTNNENQYKIIKGTIPAMITVTRL